MMEAPSYGDQISISSRKAVYWAAIMAALRAEQSDEVTSPGVDVYDLFVGILLSHPSDSEAKIILEKLTFLILLKCPVLLDHYKGMGEKFAANPITGTASLSIPIAVSPSRSGFDPELSLFYDSSSGNGLFGFGWSLE